MDHHHLAGIISADTPIQRRHACRCMHVAHVLAVEDGNPLREWDAQLEGADGGFHEIASNCWIVY